MKQSLTITTEERHYLRICGDVGNCPRLTPEESNTRYKGLFKPKISQAIMSHCPENESKGISDMVGKVSLELSNSIVSEYNDANINENLNDPVEKVSLELSKFVVN